MSNSSDRGRKQPRKRVALAVLIHSLVAMGCGSGVVDDGSGGPVEPAEPVVPIVEAVTSTHNIGFLTTGDAELDWLLEDFLEWPQDPDRAVALVDFWSEEDCPTVVLAQETVNSWARSLALARLNQLCPTPHGWSQVTLQHDWDLSDTIEQALRMPTIIVGKARDALNSEVPGLGDWAVAAAAGDPTGASAPANRLGEAFVGGGIKNPIPFTHEEITVFSSLPITTFVAEEFSVAQGADMFTAKGVIYIGTHRSTEDTSDSVSLNIDDPGRVGAGGIGIDFVVTHINTGGGEVRRIQLQEVLNVVEANWDGKRPLVVGGDFNLGSDDVDFTTFLDGLNRLSQVGDFEVELFDATNKEGWNQATLAPCTNVEIIAAVDGDECHKANQIDYLFAAGFVEQPFQEVRYAPTGSVGPVEEQLLADHAEVRLTGSARAELYPEPPPVDQERIVTVDFGVYHIGGDVDGCDEPDPQFTAVLEMDGAEEVSFMAGPTNDIETLSVKDDFVATVPAGIERAALTIFASEDDAWLCGADDVIDISSVAGEAATIELDFTIMRGVTRDGQQSYYFEQPFVTRSDSGDNYMTLSVAISPT